MREEIGLKIVEALGDIGEMLHGNIDRYEQSQNPKLALKAAISHIGICACILCALAIERFIPDDGSENNDPCH